MYICFSIWNFLSPWDIRPFCLFFSTDTLVKISCHLCGKIHPIHPSINSLADKYKLPEKQYVTDLKHICWTQKLQCRLPFVHSLVSLLINNKPLFWWNAYLESIHFYEFPDSRKWHRKSPWQFPVMCVEVLCGWQNDGWATTCAI